MKKHITKMLAAVAMSWLGGSVVAEDCAPVQVADHGQRGGWYGSAGVLVLKQFGTNIAYRTDTFSDPDPTTGASTLLSRSFTDFDSDYKWSGRLEVGVKDRSGFGLRIRYFWFEDQASINFVDDQGTETNPVFAGVRENQVSGQVFGSAAPLGSNMLSYGTAEVPSDLSYDRNLRLRAWDFDLTGDCCRGSVNLTWSAGVRFVTIDQSYNARESLLGATAFPDVTPGTQSFSSSHDLSAWGPTVGLEARTALTDNFSGFVAGRFGILYATGNASTSLVLTTQGDPANFQVPNAGVVSSRCFAMANGELEVGGEYSRCLGCDGPELFVRGSVIGMNFWGAGNAARVNSSNEPANTDLILFGFTASVGIRY
jgi:hypothetical protein